MRKTILRVIILTLFVSICFYFCGKERFMFNGDRGFPLSINTHKIPFDVVPRVWITDGDNDGDSKIFFLLENSFNCETKDPGMMSYFFNKNKDVLVYTYLDSGLNKHYMKAYTDENDFTSFKEISKQNMLLLKRYEERVVDNFFSKDNTYAVLQIFLVFLFIIGTIFIIATMGINDGFIGIKTKKIVVVIAFIFLTLGALWVFHFDYKASKYGSNYFLNFENNFHDVHLSSSEIVLKGPKDSIDYNLSIRYKDNSEIISEGDTIYWNKPIKIREILSYCRNKSDNSFLFSFKSDNKQILHATVTQTDGKYAVKEISDKEWTETTSNKECFYDLKKRFREYSSYRNMGVLFLLFILGLIIVVSIRGINLP